MDTIPILYKVIDVLAQILLSFRQKPLDTFQNNIKAVEEEYKKEGLLEEGTGESFVSLYEMNEAYKSEMEPEYKESLVKNVFEKTENFLVKTHKFLKSQLMTSKEEKIQARLKKILSI